VENAPVTVAKHDRGLRAADIQAEDHGLDRDVSRILHEPHSTKAESKKEGGEKTPAPFF
jgi:hypothetical protein